MKRLKETNSHRFHVIALLTIVVCSWCINTYLDSLLYNDDKQTISSRIKKGSYKVVDYSFNDNIDDYSYIYELKNEKESYFVKENRLSCADDVNDKDKTMVVYESNNKIISCEMKELD